MPGMRFCAYMTLTAVFLLTGCAGADIGATTALTPAQKKDLHLASVTAETTRDVQMEKEALDRIVRRITADIMSEAPNVFAPMDGNGASALTMKLVFTDYGNGDPSRRERRNVGTTHIDADILFIDMSGKVIAREQVATHF